MPAASPRCSPHFCKCIIVFNLKSSQVRTIQMDTWMANEYYGKKIKAWNLKHGRRQSRQSSGKTANLSGALQCQLQAERRGNSDLSLNIVSVFKRRWICTIGSSSLHAFKPSPFSFPSVLQWGGFFHCTPLHSKLHQAPITIISDLQEFAKERNSGSLA